MLTSSFSSTTCDSYQLAPDEYHALASAAAVVTAALTTAASAPMQGAALNAGMAGIQLEALHSSQSSLATDLPQHHQQHVLQDQNPSSVFRHGSDHHPLLNEGRSLTHDEQAEMTATLRAWAGLEGASRQEQARSQLQDFGDSGKGLHFVPPDFARHFQSQLTALTAGYYQKLQTDGMLQSQAQAQDEPGTSRTTQNRHAQGHIPGIAHTRGQQPSQTATQGTFVAQPGAEQQSLGNAAPLLQSMLTSQDDKDTQHALALVAQATSSSGLPIDSPQVRDQLLQYAHQLYMTGSKQVSAVKDEQQKRTAETMAGEQKSDEKESPTQQKSQTHTELHGSLLPLLHVLHKLHPQHLPILLLLSCAYYSQGDLAASLWYNKMILQIDPNYVESMSNIGTTLRALGRWHEAENWWWRAIKLRPGYWDAYENLLGVLCSPQQMLPNESESAAAARALEHGELPLDSQEIAPSDRQPQTAAPRFKEALRVCDFVEGNVLSKRQAANEGRLRKVPVHGGTTFESSPVYMPAHLPVAQGPRLQNLFYAKGNLKYILPDLGAVPAAREYEKAVEVALSTSEDNAYSVRDLVMATYVVGVLTLGVSLPGAHATHAAAAEISHAIGLDLRNLQHVQLVASGQYHLLSPGGGVLRLVRAAGEGLVATLLRLGGGAQLPVLLLQPPSCVQLAGILFAESQGALPAIAEAGRKANQDLNAIQSTLQQSRSMTSTILLTLAKLVQDASTRAVPGPHGTLTLGGIPASTSLLLPLYYLSITVNPAASTANNLGILLSSIPVTSTIAGSTGERQQVNGQSVALQYYTYGLQLDPKHPHLYTNFGSLLKDLNHLSEAIQMYEKAIECNPRFDVALANLGNAIKDQGRTQESVQYYRRAVEVNPNFPEALCGLVNALLAICDWKDVYADDDEGKQGLMARVVELLDHQLNEGGMYGMGAFGSGEKKPEDWAELVAQTFGKKGDAEYRNVWFQRFVALSKLGAGPEREQSKINEGSFAIRLVERALRRTQRQWYVDTYGLVTSSSAQLPSIKPTATDAQRYGRVALPTCLGTPSVPSILPFHCFTLKLSPRQIRLISHRTALRISQTTLSQPWLPSHAYPPPPPPAPRIRVAYVSSDFNNHPLAHLMQSVFGLHDRKKFEVFLYATTPSDQSPYRKKIEREAEHFVDVSTWTNQAIIARVLQDGIHIGVNLSGFTKGARNEIFAARPFPLSIHYMGFAGGLAASWNDYSVVDPIACPPEMTSTDNWRAKPRVAARLTDFAGDRDPEAEDDDWVYPDKFIYMPDSYFVTDHRQGFREPEQRQDVNGEAVRPHEMSSEEAWAEEEAKRWKARKEMWPSLPDDYVIMSDFNQLYKLEPTVFKLWLRILARVPKSILWLLRFPAAGEGHLLQYAREKFGDTVASRVIFTDVAPKDVHIHRGRIADLFLDTLECGAHTTSADILWSGTPVLTWPRHKHKMASRVAASIVAATGKGKNMIVDSEQAYEDRAVELVQSISYTYLDKFGRPLQGVVRKEPVFADALAINASSASAKPHNVKAQVSLPNTVTSGDAATAQPHTVGTDAPAPANVDQVTKESDRAPAHAQPQNTLPERSTIHLGSVGVQAPPEATLRRCHGELADLRKGLFLSRDSSRLFDTPRWVQRLESGYAEAWNRWVHGVDLEESAEWEALDDTHPAKRSGHIWVSGN